MVFSISGATSVNSMKLIFIQYDSTFVPVFLPKLNYHLAKDNRY